MPSNTIPSSTLRQGSGGGDFTRRRDLDLVGADISGPGPNTGDLEGADPPSAAYLDRIDPSDVTGLDSDLDDLSGRVPFAPPRLGYYAKNVGLDGSEFAHTGLPDWGVLKLSDYSLFIKDPTLDDNIQNPLNDVGNLFPYFFDAPNPARDAPVFTTDPGLGGDPASDREFNTGLSSVLLDGEGVGQASAGGFRRGNDVVRTTAIMTRTAVIDGGTGLPEVQAVCVSGELYPADRGVLALFYWPPDGDISDFLALDLDQRCVAALLLGNGLGSTGAPLPGQEDGTPGGIFATSTDPEVYPSRAGGQYSLREIYEGVSQIDGSDLRSPWDDLDGDTVQGVERASNADVPIPGQVRLGSDPLAGVTPLEYGIPVLGAGPEAYDGAIPSYYGKTFIHDGNFFAYRLPVLDDYSESTGLKYTPAGLDSPTTKETARYFETQVGSPAPLVSNAGNYVGFAQDNVSRQIARYRHIFGLPSTQVAGVSEDCGSYFFIHFRTERDFEKFARDGITPDDPTDGYEIYSAPLDFSSGSPEVSSNIVNEEDATALSPLGPAPGYGYAAAPYHVLRSRIYLDATSATGVSLVPSLNEFQWSVGNADSVVWVSGVAYFLNKHPTSFLDGFTMDEIHLTIPADFWGDTFRTDAGHLTGGVDPARMSTPNPLFMSFYPFSYGLSVLSSPTFTYGTGAPGPASLTSAPTPTYQGRVEIPYTHMGEHAASPFSENNAPAAADDVFIEYTGGMDFLGDTENPAFTENARVRAYFRRPRATVNPQGVILPSDTTEGHGVDIEPNPNVKVLYHSTSAGGLVPHWFGNFLTGVPVSPAEALLANSTKDYHERFLDEVYRYRDTFTALTANENDALNGPGLGAWLVSFIELPVRAGHTAGAFQANSWVQNGDHLNPLGVGDLQVAGLPDRNPLIQDDFSPSLPLSNVTKPFPSSGILLYPQKNYLLGGYRPSLADGDISAAQPNYAGSAGTRVYIRALDCNAGGSIAAAGNLRVSLRIDGLHLDDFAYVAPGPGSLSTTGIAISIKIPGTTTWLDLGRVNGDGPPKTDGLLDGAGCFINDSTTFEDYDPETGLIYSIVTADVDTGSGLEANTGANGSEVGTVPLLVRVMFDAAAAAYNLEERSTGPGVFAGGAAPGAAPSLLRGLVGIRIVEEPET